MYFLVDIIASLDSLSSESTYLGFRWD